MKSLIYIELTESIPFAYEKELILWAKKQFSDISTFDVDNQSEALMFSYAQTMAELPGKLAVYVVAEEKVSAAKALRLAEKLTSRKLPTLVIMQGENAMLNRMFGLLKDVFHKVQTEEEGKKLMEEFWRE